MVMQWEDRFYKVRGTHQILSHCLIKRLTFLFDYIASQANRAHTYLGKPESEWHQSNDEADIYPDFPAMAKSFGVPSRRVIKKSDIRGAIREMLDTPGPYLLEVSIIIQHDSWKKLIETFNSHSGYGASH